MKLSPEDRKEMARTIWGEFEKLRGPGPTSMSPAEWHLISKWLDASIPLPVILRAFSEFNGRPRVLTALEAPVNRAYAYYRQAMAL